MIGFVEVVHQPFRNVGGEVYGRACTGSGVDARPDAVLFRCLMPPTFYIRAQEHHNVHTHCMLCYGHLYGLTETVTIG